MSAHITENDNALNVFKMPCPVCIEITMVVKEGREFVPEYSLRKYTFKQLVIHLNSKKHSRDQLVEVAMRAAASLYNCAYVGPDGI
jgi:hypothetical protein